MTTKNRAAPAGTVAPISLTVNGKRQTVPPGLTVHGLLEVLDLVPATIVVERNLEILHRSAYDQTMLEEGDQIELVHFVGGG